MAIGFVFLQQLLRPPKAMLGIAQQCLPRLFHLRTEFQQLRSPHAVLQRKCGGQIQRDRLRGLLDAGGRHGISTIPLNEKPFVIRH